MARKKAVVSPKDCVACGACAAACPRKAISVSRGCFASVDVSLCVGCGLCAAACPAGAVETKEVSE